MGATLPKPVVATVLERHGSKYFRVGLAEMNGWRNSMEDAHVVHMNDREAYFGILDGHGGADCSKWCANRLHEVLAARGCPANDAAAKKMILEIDKAYLETGLDSGSTAAMCVVRAPASPGGKYQLHVINAGDSRVLLSRANGSIIDGKGTDMGLTIDHKPDHPSERERIERCGGTVQEAAGGVHRVNGDLAVSRGFGDAEYKKTGGPAQEDHPVTADPEMGHFTCDESDFVLIVCDGVSESPAFPNPDVCKVAAQALHETGGDAAKASEKVIQRAIEAGSKDNISCMIILLGNAHMGPGRIGMGKTVEFNPGCLIGCGDANFLKAYKVMCERGGVTLGGAAEKRHRVLARRKGTAEEEDTDEEELALIGSPQGAEGSPQRKAWFESWADKCHEKASSGGDDDDDGLPGGLGGGGPAEQQMMMRMLLGMMQQQRAAGGAAPGGRGGGRGAAGRGGRGR